MITVDEIRRHALALPEVEEGTHFRMPAFKVRGKSFASMWKEAHLHVSVDQAQAQDAMAEDPDAYEELWRNGTTFVGVRVDLGKVSPDRVRDLIELAWRNRAPKRLVASFDLGEGLEGGR